MLSNNHATLLTAARKAAQFAYSPYSNFRVGASTIFCESDDIYTGCNIENSSYGLTICAERSALCAGVSCGHRQLLRLAIAVLDADGRPQRGFMPCGACLQFMQEFAGLANFQSTQVIIDAVGQFALRELLPRPF